ncbi:MAG: hypothetical protein KA347_06165 [Bacteroidia bacterium]|nr:hypothetical protein [Bacteroidia bacterium]MBP7245445.1 hypothetical protein [Bacteroidia bacterium]
MPDDLVKPRPFYIIGHNTNSINEVKLALDHGANGIEPDLNVFDNNPGKISVSHDKGNSGDSALIPFLQELHTLAIKKNSLLSLVVFDCKEPLANADFGLEILMAIRQNLTYDNDINIIISVAKLSHTAIFDKIGSLLGVREGIMIDAEDDPAAVNSYFVNLDINNHCFGNGISFINSTIGPYYRYTLEQACELKAAINRPKFAYVWTVNDYDELCEYIRIGVDGIITDKVDKLKAISQDIEFAPIIRIAQRNDNPFLLDNFTYGLQVYTGNVKGGGEGTDAHITFQITGNLGTIRKTIDASLVNRMESDNLNFVTIQSPNLGDLKSITVERDNTGNGPNWYLNKIIVHSYRYGVSKVAIFNKWIDPAATYEWTPSPSTNESMTNISFLTPLLLSDTGVNVSFLTPLLLNGSN